MVLTMLVLACVPTSVDNSADDYLTLRSGPAQLVDDDGVYIGGWWDDFDGTINRDTAQGADGAWKGWIHLNLTTDRYFISSNLADLNSAANTALLIVDRETGEIDSVSINDTFGDKEMTAADDFSEVTNDGNGSTMRMDGTDGLSFALNADALTMEGSATARLAPFVQTSRYHDGYGSLQWWGNVEADAGTTFTIGDEVIDLSGALGTYDRTLGHRRTHQNWNWLSAIGTATRDADGEAVAVSLLMAKDRELARPIVEVQKYNVWVGDTLSKLPALEFEYEYTDEDEKETGDWRIYTPTDDGDWVDLSFEPEYHRRDQEDYLWFVHTDFNQYYGSLSGSMSIDGELYTIESIFALTEDSLLIL